MSSVHIILASASPRRQELIQTLGLPVTMMPSDADERIAQDVDPAETVEILSLRKAQDVAGTVRAQGRFGAVVVGSDTVVFAEGQKLGKPKDAEDAVAMLRRLQGRTHEVYTGVACVKVTEHPGAEAARPPVPLSGIGRCRIVSVLSDGAPRIIIGHTVSKVTFRPMTDEEICAYADTGIPLDKAGAYGVQGLGSIFIEKIEGDFYSIMGLPLNLLYSMLLHFGISPFSAK